MAPKGWRGGSGEARCDHPSEGAWSTHEEGPLRDNSDLAFRIQLLKSSLQIDTTPTEATVMTYAHHLLAEVEQVARQDRRGEKRSRLSPTRE